MFTNNIRSPVSLYSKYNPRDYNMDGYESEYGYPLTSLPDSRHLIPSKGATIWSQGHPYSRLSDSIQYHMSRNLRSNEFLRS